MRRHAGYDGSLETAQGNSDGVRPWIKCRNRERAARTGGGLEGNRRGIVLHDNRGTRDHPATTIGYDS
jgi:hypothetical protein